MQVKGRNYLIPIAAEIYEETDIKYEAVDAGRLGLGASETQSVSSTWLDGSTILVDIIKQYFIFGAPLKSFVFSVS